MCNFNIYPNSLYSIFFINIPSNSSIYSGESWFERKYITGGGVPFAYSQVITRKTVFTYRNSPAVKCVLAINYKQINPYSIFIFFFFLI